MLCVLSNNNGKSAVEGDCVDKHVQFIDSMMELNAQWAVGMAYAGVSS